MDTNNENISPAVKLIFDAIAKGDLDELKNILAQHRCGVDIFDENGMTPLQHASFKGNKDMVQLLLDMGADVNSSKHEYGYTALHFGALSGNAEVCRLLLDAGAQPTVTNSVGRSAAQMAAFVGNHQTVTTINTFIPRREIAVFAQKSEDSETRILPLFLVDPLHKFVLGVNIHPVRLALNIQHNPSLLEKAALLSIVLEMMCKREMGRGTETNEVTAFKYHYLSYILKEISHLLNKQKSGSENDEKKPEIIEMFAKRLLKPGKDGVTLDTMETFLKDCIREFPYRECTIFRQMVSALTSEDPPSALSVIDCTINGQRGYADSMPCCSTCGEEKPAKKCSKCKSVQYCDRECQRLHWFVHKKACNRETSVQSASTAKVNIDANELSSELQKLVAG